jgi:hypothetical protein
VLNGKTTQNMQISPRHSEAEKSKIPRPDCDFVFYLFEEAKGFEKQKNPIEMGSSYLFDSNGIFVSSADGKLRSLKLIRVPVDGIQQFLCKFTSSQKLAVGGRQHKFHMNSYGT